MDEYIIKEQEFIRRIEARNAELLAAPEREASAYHLGI